jgi:hypothetical protein
MAFSGAHNIHVSDSIFNEVGGNQYNFQTTNIQVTSSSHLAQAFSAARLISSMVTHVEIDREQLKDLSQSIDTLLRELNAKCAANRLLDSTTSEVLEKLNE